MAKELIENISSPLSSPIPSLNSPVPSTSPLRTSSPSTIPISPTITPVIKSSTSSIINITSMREWNEIKNKINGHAIKLFISGDRNITNLKEFILYAPNFISMNFFHTRMKNLAGLEKFTNLKSLNVSRTEVINEELKYLSKLISLERLELNGNIISDLTPLRDLVNLEHLGLACLKMKSLNGIGKMTKLKILDLFQNQQLEEITQLTSLKNLRDLDIRDTRIESASIKKSLPNITTLIS